MGNSVSHLSLVFMIFYGLLSLGRPGLRLRPSRTALPVMVRTVEREPPSLAPSIEPLSQVAYDLFSPFPPLPFRAPKQQDVFIPIPDNTGLVEDYESLYPPDRWRELVSYVKTSETIEETTQDALSHQFTYLMDERDKEWLDKNNEEARGEGTSAQGAVSVSITVRLSHHTVFSLPDSSFPKLLRTIRLSMSPYRTVRFRALTLPSDPDIQHLPFFAITPAFFKSLYSSESYCKRELTFDHFAQFVIAVQHRLFYLVMSLGRFNLYRLSYQHLWITRREPSKARGGRWAWWLEVIALWAFLVWYGSLVRGCGPWQKGLMYLLVSNVVPSPLHVQVALGPRFLMAFSDRTRLDRSFPLLALHC
jgi:hypothetical protein